LLPAKAAKAACGVFWFRPFPGDPLPTIRMHALAGNGKKTQRNARPIAVRLPGDRAKNVRIQSNERNTAA